MLIADVIVDATYRVTGLSQVEHRLINKREVDISSRQSRKRSSVVKGREGKRVIKKQNY